MSNRLLHMTSALSAPGAALGMPALILPDRRLRRVRFIDAMMTYDRKVVDSTGAFLIGELERLDQKLHDPLVSVSWSRDIDLREDVTIGDEVSSFTNSSFASAGGITPGGKAWISKDANSITGIALDIGKTANPLYLWGMELKYTLPELDSAQRLGRPVDAQKYAGMQLKHQMDIDEMVYTGDTTLGKTGLVNSALVTPISVLAGVGGNTWALKTPDEILADFNKLLNDTWAAAGWAVMPSKVLLPPLKFSYLVSQKVSSAGNMSILQYLKDNSLCNAANGTPLDIQPVKWLTGAGAAGVDRMVAYTQNVDRVRYPLVPLQRTPLEYRSLFQMTTYYGRLGVVELVYPETVGYMDGM